jgi:hypothetical protein
MFADDDQPGWLYRSADEILPDDGDSTRHDAGSYAQDTPGKRARRSLTYSPHLGEPLASEHGRAVARSGIGFNTRWGHAPSDLTPQPSDCSLQRLQFSAGNTDHLGCFNADARIPSVGFSY